MRLIFYGAIASGIRADLGSYWMVGLTQIMELATGPKKEFRGQNFLKPRGCNQFHSLYYGTGFLLHKIGLTRLITATWVKSTTNRCKNTNYKLFYLFLASLY